jgi:7-cyano-7-deazaguanine synthase
METKKRAVVLLSGGMDSATCLAVAVAEGFDVFTLTFDYGQRHQCEVALAAKLSVAYAAKEHQLIPLGFGALAKSALTFDGEVPKDTIREGIPPTYVPARNTVFLSMGLAWAEVLGARDLFIGVNQVDYSGYPDCRAEFIDAFEKMANLATCMGTEGKSIKIQTPLIALRKSEIIRLGHQLGVDYSKTHTCYDPNPQGLACGRCPACLLRLEGFEKIGQGDPIAYQKRNREEPERKSST